MDPVPTSFIPKKALVEESAHGGMGGLVTLLAVLVFLASILAAGGTFAYTKYLGSALADKDASLKKAEGAFDTRSIQDLEHLDSRLTQARTLLQNHTALSGVFTFLSATTLERVQFTSLALNMDGSGSATLAMDGIADSFSTLALQSDQFGAAKVLRDVIFSGITTGFGGRVTFSVSARVDPSLLSYAKNNTPAVSVAPADAPAQN